MNRVVSECGRGIEGEEEAEEEEWVGEGEGMSSGKATSLTILRPQWSTPNSSERPTQARSGVRMRTSLEDDDESEWDFLRWYWGVGHDVGVTAELLLLLLVALGEVGVEKVN